MVALVSLRLGASLVLHVFLSFSLVIAIPCSILGVHYVAKLSGNVLYLYLHRPTHL